MTDKRHLHPAMRLCGHIILGGLLLLPVAGPLQAYQAVTVDNGASISGRVGYSGRVPSKKIIPSNPETCGSPRDIALIETDQAGGVTDAVVYLTSVERGKAWPLQDRVPELDNRDCRFVPQLIAMPPGPITIVNSDPVLHNTHAFYGRRTALNIALPKQGLRIEKELRRPGLVRVECDEHGHMSARILVAENPYYATTASAGEYVIDGIPPGEYDLVVYQEETGPLETRVKLQPGQSLKLDIDLATGLFSGN